MKVRYAEQSGHSPGGHFDHLYRPAFTPGSARPPPRRALPSQLTFRPSPAMGAKPSSATPTATVQNGRGALLGRNGRRAVVCCASSEGRFSVIRVHLRKPIMRKGLSMGSLNLAAHANFTTFLRKQRPVASSGVGLCSVGTAIS